MTSYLYNVIDFQFLQGLCGCTWPVYTLLQKNPSPFYFLNNANNQKYVWIILLKWLFWFLDVKWWLHLTGEVDNSVRCSCQIFSRFNRPKIIKIGQFCQSYSKKWMFLEHSVDCTAVVYCIGYWLMECQWRRSQGARGAITSNKNIPRREYLFAPSKF